MCVSELILLVQITEEFRQLIIIILKNEQYSSHLVVIIESFLSAVPGGTS